MSAFLNIQMYILLLYIISADITHATAISTTDLKNILDKIELLQLELNTVKDTLTEVRQDYIIIKNQNEDMKKENDILKKKISSLETNYLKLTIQPTPSSKPECEIRRETDGATNSKNIKRTHLEVEERKNEDDTGEDVGPVEKSNLHKRLLIPNTTPTSSQIVAFTAVLTHPVQLGPLQTIEYDKIITNIGNAYETRDGQFNAPVSGVYLISATLYTTGNPVFTEIVKNGQQLAAMYGDHNDHAGHTIAVLLHKTDRVWVRHFHDNNIAHIYSDVDRYYCTFSGVLLALLYSSHSVVVKL